ncbi:MAG: AraC family transcriptional regulator [Afipia sp.]
MILRSDDFTSGRLSSTEFPAEDRIEAVREIYGRAILHLDVEPLPDSPFQVDMTLRALPGLSIAVGDTSHVRCRRTSELIDSDDFLLTAVLSGGCVVTQRGREARIEEGQAVLTTNAETSVHAYCQDSRFMNVRLPLNMAASLTDLFTALMRPVPRDTQSLQLLVDYVKALRDLDQLATPELRHLAATHMHDLAALALGATRDAAETARGRGVRAARLRAIKADVIENIGRRSLSAAGVAARHRVSERYFRKLFEMEGASFSDFLLEQRLARAHRLLTTPHRNDSTISEIAFEVGFGDLSHFNRTFRRRYGATPSGVREAARLS